MLFFDKDEASCRKGRQNSRAGSETYQLQTSKEQPTWLNILELQPVGICGEIFEHVKPNYCRYNKSIYEYLWDFVVCIWGMWQLCVLNGDLSVAARDDAAEPREL